MSIRTRVTLLAAGAVAVAVVLACGAAFFTASRTLRDDVDDDLVEATRQLVGATAGPRGPRLPGGRPPVGPRPGQFGGAGVFVQLVDAGGDVPDLPGGDSDLLPVDDETLAVARGEAGPFFRTVEVDGVDVRIRTVPLELGPGGDTAALQVARSLEEVGDALRRLAGRLVIVGMLGIGAAALLGHLVARRAVRPVERLTDTAERVGSTGDLGHRIEVDGDDEVARLARTFNAMLASLQQARTAQDQLVADASHELRTPLTSLRTNIEVLTRGDALDAADRRRLVDDVVTQLDEFGRLVGHLVELTRGEQPLRSPTPVRLDTLAAGAVERMRTHAPDADLRTDLDEATVVGERDRLSRALDNLLDNAVKYAGDGPIEVQVRPGEVVVRDHGPGIDPTDLPHVFDRFYRAPGARARPGSGLGLAIVRQVAEAHGGEVRAEPAPGGGTRFVLRVPPAPPGGGPSAADEPDRPASP